MPPDLTAGLIAPACPLPPTGPPGAASKLVDPSGSSALNAALFASLLMQSSPPNLKLAAPKADAPPTVKLGSTAKQQISKNWKTMDTLPALSFAAAGTALKASELLSSSPAGHKAGADDKTATANTPNNALNAALTVVPITVPVQAVLLPVLTPAAAPTPSRVLKVAAPSASSLAAPSTASAVPASFAGAPPLPAKVSLPLLPAPTAVPAPTASFVFSGSTPPQSAPLTAFVSASLPRVSPLLPQTSQTPVLQTPQALAPQLPLPAETPQAAGQITPQKQSVPEEIAPAAPVTAPAKTTADLPQVLPHTVALGTAALDRAVPLQPLSPAQAAPSLPPLIPNQAIPNHAIPNTASTAALSAFVQPAAAAPPVIAPALLSSGPAKPLGKSVPTALKSAPANADTNTRIAETGVEAKPLLVKAPAVTAPVLPAKLPGPDLGSRSSVSEKTAGAETVDAKAQIKAPTGMLETAMPAAQAAPLTAAPSGRPLSASDQIKIVHQVADGVGAMPLPAKPGGVQQMSLQLHPKDWGSLQVSVSVIPAQEAGTAKTVTAHIVAETPQVKAALQSQTGALHQALRASGLNLTHLTVSVKPAAETVPASHVASTGFSAGQGQPNTGSRDAQPAQATPGSQSAGMQFGTSAGSSQSGRQGQPPTPMSASARAEAEEIAPVRQLMRPSGRIDTHA